jgi:hypothetical protein
LAPPLHLQKPPKSSSPNQSLELGTYPRLEVKVPSHYNTGSDQSVCPAPIVAETNLWKKYIFLSERCSVGRRLAIASARFYLDRDDNWPFERANTSRQLVGGIECHPTARVSASVYVHWRFQGHCSRRDQLSFDDWTQRTQVLCHGRALRVRTGIHARSLGTSICSRVRNVMCPEYASRRGGVHETAKNQTGFIMHIGSTILHLKPASWRLTQNKTAFGNQVSLNSSKRS